MSALREHRVVYRDVAHAGGAQEHRLPEDSE